MNTVQRWIVTAGDLLIPLAGWLFWKWNLDFLLYFYLLDFLVAQGVFYYKDAKIRHVQELPFRWLGSTSNLLLLVSIIGMSGLFLWAFHPRFDLGSSLSAFWNLKDMGIAQGYLLVPLLLFAGYQQVKMDFILPNLAGKTDHLEFWKKHLRGQFVTFGFAAFFSTTIFLYQLPEWTYVLLLIGSVTAFRFVRR